MNTASFHVLRPKRSYRLRLPLYGAAVAAGFPSPADEYIEGKLDLNEYLVAHPTATFFVRVTGESMVGARIYPGDLLIVDRSLEARPGKVVIAVVDGELTVKRLKKGPEGLVLTPENDLYEPLFLTDETDARLWGVVTNVIHSV